MIKKRTLLDALIFDETNWTKILQEVNLELKDDLTKGDFVRLVMQAIFNQQSSIVLD